MKFQVKHLIIASYSFSLLFPLIALKSNSEIITQYYAQDQQQVTYSDEQCLKLLKQKEHYENMVNFDSQLGEIIDNPNYGISETREDLVRGNNDDMERDRQKLYNVNSQLQQYCPGY